MDKRIVIHHSMQQTQNQKEWTTDTNNMDKSQDHYVKLKEKSHTKRLPTVWLHLYNTLEKAKFIQESVLVINRDWRNRLTARGQERTVGVMEMFLSWLWQWLHNSNICQNSSNCELKLVSFIVYKLYRSKAEKMYPQKRSIILHFSFYHSHTP